MKIVISPAKSLDYESKLPTTRGTQPQFLETTKEVNERLKQLSKKEISELMSISDKLADLNFMRYKNFEPEHHKKNSRPAMYAFAGDVYVGLDAYSIPTKKLNKLQDTLRILSGFYGILRPLDLIQPYRLEMGTKISVSGKKDLYELWQEKVTTFLNSEMKEGEPLINLASNEYFKAIDKTKLKAQIITPIFKDYKNGELKIIAFYAKKARGSMVRYISDKNIKNFEGLKAFDYEEYRYSEELSNNKKGELVFTR